ncbi:phage tail tape measure protein [Xenorhabdus sp. Vera]|uniref:phage tail tape measure protein n=1 Tax=Xenorhabdus koppenhoeferi TaxID=351659 RepID=UPI0019CAA713|nr:phage tail tape measure protein [Xenorhabdus sp. Vera]MBD2812187.1 phage tail tape measure protein [Xenorhabdus sp. Vera]
MANLSTLTVGLLLNATSFRSQITGAYRHAGRESERFSDKAKKDAKKAESAYLSLGKQIKSVSGQLMLLAGTGFSLGSILTATRKYGQALSDLQAITGATGAQLRQLDENAQRLGRTTEFGAARITEAFKLMASAKPELLQSAAGLTLATEKAVTLAQAAGIELPEATKALALSLNQFGASAEQADRFINVLAAGAKYGSSEIGETAQAIKNGGTVAAQAGIGFEELNAAVQILAERGIKGAEAGTAIRNVVLALERSTDKKLKPSVVGLSSALEHLTTKNLSTAEAVRLFGRANVSAASNLVTGRSKLDELTRTLTGTQVAYEQASARANNLSSDLDVLGSAVEGMLIKIGNSADGPLRAGVQGATSAVNTLAENFNLITSVALHALIPVIATKLTAGLRENVSAWKATEKATRGAAKQKAETARRTIEQANATIQLTQRQGEHIEKMRKVNAQHGVFVNYSKESRALYRQETEAFRQKERATRQLELANRRLSFSYQALSMTAGFARGALAMIGGPFGAAMLAGSALYGLYNHSVQTREGLRQLKDTTIETIAELQRLSKVKIEIGIDEINEKIEELQDERKQIVRRLGGYSDTRINLAKKGFFVFTDHKKLEKEKRELLSQLEDIDKGLETQTKRRQHHKETLSTGKFNSPLPPPPKIEGNNGNPWTGEGSGDNDKNNNNNKGKQTLNQYQQLRKEIEQAHATSLGRIILSEQENQRKLAEVGKSGLVSQSEISRLMTLNAENHQKQRVALAEKYAPARALIRQEQEANQELKALYSTRLLTEQEYLSASRMLYQTSVRDKLAEQAKQWAAPRLDIAGEVDPVVQLKNQLTEQTALYDAYYMNNRISKERYEQLTTAATLRAKEAQFSASKELYAAQGNWQKMQMNLLDTVEQRTGNALTGMLTGSKSFSESMKELSASLAQSIIQDLVRIAMQAMITKAISGFFGGMSGTGSLASAGGNMSSANTGAMGMSTSWRSFVPNAKGGVYQSADLSQYSGQIVSSPTLFKFAKGGGLMGEAGPEAILPLKRGSDGALGVEAMTPPAAGSGGIHVYQTIQVSGNGDQVLLAAMEEAARRGAEQGAATAKANLIRDFQTNGQIRKTLGV